MPFAFYRNYKYAIWQFVRLALISGILFFLILLISLATITYVYQDRIKQAFVESLNQRLKTQIFVDDISIGAIKSFPRASVSLYNIRVMESDNAFSKDTLLKAESISLHFSLMDVFRGDYNVKQMHLNKGYLRMKTFPDNSNNYVFWDTSTATDSEFHFVLNQFNLIDFQYRYHNQKSNAIIDVSFKNGLIQGDFSRDLYLLTLKGDCFVSMLEVDGAQLITRKNLSLNIDFDVEQNTTFHIRKGYLNLEGNSLHVEGSINLSGDHPYLDLQAKGNNLRLENALMHLPVQYQKYFENYRSRGQFDFLMSVKGYVSHVVNPYVSASFGLTNAQLSDRKNNIHLKSVSFTGSFDNGSRRGLSSATLNLEDFESILERGKVSGTFHVFNFNSPELETRLSLEAQSSDLVNILKLDTIEFASGNIAADIYFKGRLKGDWTLSLFDFNRSRVSGFVETNDLSFTLKNDPLRYKALNTKLRFNNNDVVIEHFSGKVSESDFRLKGYLRNLIPYFLYENERLYMDAHLNSKYINFNELLHYQSNEQDTIHKLSLSDRVDFSFRADIQEVKFKKFHATHLKGSLSMRNQLFNATDVSFHAMKGLIKANAFIDGRSKNDFFVGCEAQIAGVDVYDLFYQLNDFGQDAIVADNMRGRLEADLSFRSHWTPFLIMQKEALELTADVKIQNGELINYQPMLALSRFIRVGDLNHVRFSTLENKISIKNQKILIPNMEINSDAINLQLSGEHTFDNEIDYRIRVLLSDILARRHRQSRNPQEQYGDIIDDGLRTTLYLRVGGTVDNPTFRYDTQSAREQLRKDLREERQNMREVFRTEFGLPAKDDSVSPKGIQDESSRKRREIRKREEGNFVIEWDEN